MTELAMSDLAPEVQIELDVFLTTYRDFDVSGYRLRRLYLLDGQAIDSYMLVCPVCVRTMVENYRGHVSACLCVIYRSASYVSRDRAHRAGWAFRV